MPISSYSDDELLSAIRRDDEKAFAELFERYWKQVHTMAYALVLSRDASQEIVKNVFVSLWEQRATLSISHLPSYLNAEIKNCMLNYINARLTHTQRLDYCKKFIAQHTYVTQVNELRKKLTFFKNIIEFKPK
jgi:DNA-directed RNA polymerase specialized sigma24 family protein